MAVSSGFVEGVTVSTLLGGVWAVYKFARESRDNRRWKQTEFLIELNQKFFDSEDIKNCISKLDNEEEIWRLKRIFESDRSSLTAEQLQEIEKFRTFFQFFDNLYYCHEMKVLSIEQINLFGWFLRNIRKQDFIRGYCQSAGFGNVVILADELEEHVRSSRYIRRHNVSSR